MKNREYYCKDFFLHFQGVNADIAYYLSEDAGGVFAIDAVTGMITVSRNQVLDRETNQHYTLKVRIFRLSIAKKIVL